MTNPAAPEFKVYCAFTQMVDPTTLVAHPENPNEHPEKQIELFQEIFKFNGWRRAITVSKRSGFVTKGHGALLGALAAGAALVPVDYQDYSSDEQERADILADNQLSEWSTLNQGKLESLLGNLRSAEINLEVTGFDKASLERMFSEFTAAKGPDVGDLAQLPPAPAPDAEPPAGGPVYSNQVKMVQLFFNKDDQAAFITMTSDLSQAFSKDNLTDTVMEAIREAHSARFKNPS